MSLKDALNKGVGGLNLSEEDFQNVATKLLFQEGPDKLIVPANVIDGENVIHVPENNSALQPKPTRSVVQSHHTLLKATNCDIIKPSCSQSFREKKVKDDAVYCDELDSVLVSDSGLSSDTSEVVSLFNSSVSSVPAKKRGGWPKGRKRKPENKTDIRQPKAPVTGYVIFLNERRKDYKDLPFTEVTKLLGNEWSRLSLQEKKRYLDQAEVDKKRYREELKAYRQSDAYRQYLQRKRLKRSQGHGTEESDMDATDEIDEEDSEELYCRSCDQWFHSLHNKKEHLYGRQHLTKIASRGKVEDWTNCASLDESSLDGCREDAKEKKPTVSLDMDDAIVRFMARNLERERELTSLRQREQQLKSRNRTLLETLAELNSRLSSANSSSQEEEQAHFDFGQKIFNLLNVPSVFTEADN